MKIFTYYTNCAGHNPEDELKLIALWREAWAKLGCEPFVLQEWHARQCPGFSVFNNAVSQLPTVNSQNYERACFVRWLALAQAGGGWMMDYDVFPNRFEVFPPMTGAQMNRLQLMQNNCVCPCLIYASADVAMRVCGEFATGQWGKRRMGDRDHYSDQYALEDLVNEKVDWIEQHGFALLYGDPGWEKAPAVHFANAAMGPRGKTPRWKHIPNILEALR